MQLNNSVNRVVMPTNVNTDRYRQRKVVYYGRVSTEHEAQLSALENQLQWYDDQTKYHSNWTVLRKYIDEGITGTQAKKRPAFLEMIADAKSKKFDLIVTREVCRFARNTVDTLVVTRELKEYGVEVYFVEDNIWTMDNDGELRLSLMATLAQEESRKTSERVRAGQKISRDKGVLYGNGNILGYDRDKNLGTYVINEEQAETVRMIYSMYFEGFGFKKIAQELLIKGRKNASGKIKWDMTTVSRIIHNATYKGYNVYLKSRINNYLDQKVIRNKDEDTYLYVKGAFKPIISEEIWDKCRKIRDSKRIAITSSYGETQRVVGHKMSENIWVYKLQCKCGASFRRNKWRKRKSGEIVYGYKCYNQLNNGAKLIWQNAGVEDGTHCDMSELCDWKIDMMAREVFRTLWTGNNESVICAYQLYQKNYENDKNSNGYKKENLFKQIEKFKSKLEELTNMRMDKEISKEEYQDYRIKINTDIHKYEQELYSIENTANGNQNDKLSLDNFMEYFNQKLDFSGIKVDDKLIDKFVYKVIPENKNEYKWYMSLLPKGKDLSKYREIISFVIPFDKASAYRIERGGYLRPTQYNDLIVHVYM